MGRRGRATMPCDSILRPKCSARSRGSLEFPFSKLTWIPLPWLVPVPLTALTQARPSFAHRTHPDAARLAPRSASAPPLARASPGMSTGTSSTELAVIPPPPDPAAAGSACCSPCFLSPPSTMAASTIGHYVAVACQRYAQPDKEAPSHVVFTPFGREIRLCKSASPPPQTDKPSRKRPALDEVGVRPTSAPVKPTSAPERPFCIPERPKLLIGHSAPELSQEPTPYDIDREFGLLLRLTQLSWLEMQRKREAGVEAVKRSADYQQFPRFGLFAQRRPPTPDPADRTVSKRSWEAGMQRWRRDLRGNWSRAPGAVSPEPRARSMQEPGLAQSHGRPGGGSMEQAPAHARPGSAQSHGRR